MSTAQLSPGTVVDGKFTIGEPGHSRAGAQTYAATDPQGQAVVVTAYDAACFPSNLVLERSLRELRQLQSLQSERVAPVIACGKLPEGGIFEVNGPLPSQRLDEMMSNGPLAAPEAAALITQVGEGLLEAQKAGVIHRNLGPRVVYVSGEGVVLAGFAVGEPHGDKSFGPLDTIAPEQVKGKVVDQRTLIYNLAALMHLLLEGTPLFPGDGPTQREAHLSADPPAETHARLKRALGKDPRMRPMMLKQFISELRAIGGGVARAPVAPSAKGGNAPPMPGESPSKGSGPSSRGWTMFMKEDGSPSAPSGAKAPPTPGGGAPKPKTRGWTMFMEAADEEPKKKAEEAPKPSTRGWTMFMEDDEAEGGTPEAAAEASKEAAPAAEDPGKPKTRGWTMFMESDESDEAKAAAAEKSEEAPAEAESESAAPPSVGGAAPKPSTRGWTMFMKAEDSDEAKAAASGAPSVSPPTAKAPAVSPPTAKAPAVSPPAAKAPAVSPPAAAPAAKAPKAPAAGGAAGGPPGKSRGWTMFMEPAAGGPAKAPSVGADAEEPEEAAAAPEAEAAPEVEAAAPAAEAAPEAEAEAAAPTATPGKRDGDAPAKKRGWTMFMDKPIADSSDEDLGGVVPSPGESSAKGWTVFSPAADGSGEAVAEAPAADAPAGDAAEGPEAPAADAPPPQESPAPVAAEMEAPVAEPTPEPPRRSQTVVTGPQQEVQAPPQAAARAARGRTVVAPPGSGPAAANPMAPPGPVAVPGGDTGPVSGPISGPVSGPISGPVSGQMAPVEARAVAPVKKSNTGAIVAVVVVVIAIVIGAVFALG